MSSPSLPDFVVRDVDLSLRTTLALPGRAAFYAEISDTTQLRALAGRCALRRFVLGAGSNLVLTGDFDGLLLHMAIGGRRLFAEDVDAWYVQAGAGENHGISQSNRSSPSQRRAPMPSASRAAAKRCATSASSVAAFERVSGVRR